MSRLNVVERFDRARSRLAPLSTDEESVRQRASVPPRSSTPVRVAHLLLSMHRALILECELDETMTWPTHDAFTFRCLTSLDSNDELVDATDDPERVRDALRRGEEVNVVMDGAVFAGRSTMDRTTFREPFMGLDVYLVEGRDVWVGDSYTVPVYRRHGVGTFRGRCMQAMLRDMGVERVYASVEDWNGASRGLSRQSGYREIQRFRFVRVFRRFGMYVPGSARPRVHPLVRTRRWA